ncbi:MAG TPA: hypothetical protein VK817_19690 [Trebonia sp.]|jgi:hypothetical protein|nr:hypothetical protein [Trebonia sp.]
MKVRATPVAGAVTLLVLVSAAVAGCTTSGSPHPSISTGASASGPAAASSTAKASATTSAKASSSAKASASPTSSATTGASPSPSSPGSFTYVATPPPSASATHYPHGAPQTGGGGTAGLQDGTAIGLGAAAIAAGFGSLAYRRRVKKSR